jgi:hypothetical protein
MTIPRLPFKAQTQTQLSPEKEGARLDLTELLGSACRRKIIEYLAENGSTNIMRVILGIRGKYPQTNAELQILQKEDIIIDQHIGRMRIIKLNKENPKTCLILQALKILHSNDGKDRKKP